MTTITFYEKPGCGGNARQKAILEMAGHTVVAKNLLLEPWTRQRLIEFLDQLPVAHWFNRAAPEVKSGEIAPEKLDREAALSLLLNHPLLIRRPLMQAEDGALRGARHVGFVLEDVDAWVGLGDAWPDDAPRPVTAEGCVHAAGQHCPTPS